MEQDTSMLPEAEASGVQESLPVRQTRRERKAEKKARRQRRRKERQAAYRALSGGRKLLYWLKRIVIAAAILAAVFFGGRAIVMAAVEQYYAAKYEESILAQAPQEEILAVAPPDTEGDARVALTKPFHAGDTWAIYMYLCGADLESMGRSALSDTTQYLLQEEADAFTEQNMEDSSRRFHAFTDEMRRQGMKLPEYLFLPVDNTPYASEETSDPEGDGFATKNLRDALSVELPENVSLIIQTGGAANWSLPQINPNASQRFLFDSNGLTELTSDYPQNMGSQDTLSDFLRFCTKEHPADHQMLLFWNHGGGAFGFCYDELFDGDPLTLSELNGALASVYGESPETPPFELVGFDACLMASVEAAESLNGYARYLAASEELEPGSGWPYAKWLNALCEHPEMNGAQLGKAITDAFVEDCANTIVNLKWLNVDSVATFSIVDVDRAHSVYEAYAGLASAALTDAADTPYPFAALGRAAGQSIRFAGQSYKHYNTVDLGVFMENLLTEYPEEAAAVQKALDEAVLYHRETSYGQGAKGLSVYFPAEVDSLPGLLFYLKYLDTVCANPDIKALYYYKIAGCLSPELQAYAEEAGYGAFPVLNTLPLQRLSSVEPTVNEDRTVEFPVSNEVAERMQGMSVTIGRYLPDENGIRFLGEDECLYLDEYRNLRTSFDGRWIMLDGHCLMLEVIDRTDSYIRYRSPVVYDGTENSYLVLASDRKTGEISILGVQVSDQAADTMCRNLQPVEVNVRITPCYRYEDLASGAIRQEHGESFYYQYDSVIQSSALEDGEYYLVITVTDIRGDEYYPAPIAFTMQGQTISDMSIAEDILVYASAE